MGNQLDALVTVFTEFYFWITVPLMFLIHVGFCLYEVSVSRAKNKMHTLMKNAMLIPVVTITFFLFGFWIYFALPKWPFGDITGGTGALPWDVTMGSNFKDHITGVFWAAFLLFSWTAASIVSGAVIERIRTGAFLILAVLVGSVTWVIDAAWGWHAAGWMVTKLGYHDAYASGVIHGICGGAALGILIHLGPRIGKFAPDGTPRNINPHNPWFAVIGLFIIYTGFWGFYAACNTPIFDFTGDGTVFTAITIYGTPTTLSTITFNFLLSLAGGLMAGYTMSKGDAYWTFSGGLGGIIAASAGNDLYHPLQAFLIGIAGVVVMYKLHYWVERKFKIDDAVGAVAVHGYAGSFGVIICGFMLWGYPALADGSVTINPVGQIIGAIIMFFVLGFIPTYIVAGILKAMGVLRIPREVELAGLDYVEEQGLAVERQEIINAELIEANR
jgi:Amt family ammonium transporter